MNRGVALAGLAVLMAGCIGQMPTRPVHFEPKVDMRLDVSSDVGDPAHPITMHARATNVGRQTVYYPVGCDPSVPGIAVRPPAGTTVIDVCKDCPNIICIDPACAAGTAPLRPGQTIEMSGTFDARYYDCEGPYDGQSGA